MASPRFCVPSEREDIYPLVKPIGKETEKSSELVIVGTRSMGASDELKISNTRPRSQSTLNKDRLLFDSNSQASNIEPLHKTLRGQENIRKVIKRSQNPKPRTKQNAPIPSSFS